LAPMLMYADEHMERSDHDRGRGKSEMVR